MNSILPILKMLKYVVFMGAIISFQLDAIIIMLAYKH